MGDEPKMSERLLVEMKLLIGRNSWMKKKITWNITKPSIFKSFLKEGCPIDANECLRPLG